MTIVVMFVVSKISRKVYGTETLCDLVRSLRRKDDRPRGGEWSLPVARVYTGFGRLYPNPLINLFLTLSQS